jgi:hypothetical protein
MKAPYLMRAVRKLAVANRPATLQNEGLVDLVIGSNNGGSTNTLLASSSSTKAASAWLDGIRRFSRCAKMLLINWRPADDRHAAKRN